MVKVSTPKWVAAADWWWPARLAAAAAVEGGRETRVRVSCVRWRR